MTESRDLDAALLLGLEGLPGCVFAMEVVGSAAAVRWLYLSDALANLLRVRRREYPLDAAGFIGQLHPDDWRRLQMSLLHESIAGTREQVRLNVDGVAHCLDMTFRGQRSNGVHIVYGYATEIPTVLGPPGSLRIWTSILEQSTEGVLVCDPDSRILFVNPAFQRLTGYSVEEVVGQTPRILRSGRQDADFYARMWRALLADGSWQGEIINRRKDGELYVEWLSIRAVHTSGRVSHYVAVFADITERKRAQERVEQLANFDPLTELPNRLLLTFRMESLLDGAARDRSKVALLLVDLDRFKTINNSIGHAAGDLLLKAIGARLSTCVRRSDVVARVGSDEFAVALPGIAGRDAAEFAAQKILDEIAQPLTLGGEEVSVSACIGISVYPDDATSVADMLRNADGTLHQAKEAGDNLFRFYAPGNSERVRAALTTQNALRRALQSEQFELYYQPQILLAGGTVVGAEALIRWHRPNHGMVPPDQFIAIAEESGLIAGIGEWVLRAAISQVARWSAAGLPQLTVAVNLSASQFHERKLAGHVMELLRSSGVAPGQLQLEITESTIVRNADATIAILQQLHAFGVQLSIDDFGTGYSSLSYLRRFPVDEIKIDKSFVRDMIEDRSSARIVAGIVALAHSLGLRVIAEGVETAEQLALLRADACDAAQGYLIARPRPASELEQFLREWPASATARLLA